jgi:hypothetical protein
VAEAGYYIYCVAQDGPDGVLQGITGHGGEEVLGIRYRDLTAYVSRTDLTHIETTYENLRCHENVITRIMDDYELLPMCFSTICVSRSGVGDMLSKYYDQLKDNLSVVTGKIELGVKVFCRMKTEEDEPRGKAAVTSPKDYMMSRYDSYMKNKRQSDELLGIIMGFHKKLTELSSDFRYTKPMKNNLVFNASYLVPKCGKAEFDSAVAEIIALYPDFRIIYSGPWPAYHFITIKQKGDDDEQP